MRPLSAPMGATRCGARPLSRAHSTPPPPLLSARVKKPSQSDLPKSGQAKSLRPRPRGSRTRTPCGAPSVSAHARTFTQSASTVERTADSVAHGADEPDAREYGEARVAAGGGRRASATARARSRAAADTRRPPAAAPREAAPSPSRRTNVAVDAVPPNVSLLRDVPPRDEVPRHGRGRGGGRRGEGGGKGGRVRRAKCHARNAARAKCCSMLFYGRWSGAGGGAPFPACSPKRVASRARARLRGVITTEPARGHAPDPHARLSRIRTGREESRTGGGLEGVRKRGGITRADITGATSCARCAAASQTWS